MKLIDLSYTSVEKFMSFTWN